MTCIARIFAAYQMNRSWGRWLLIVVAALILSACRGIDTPVANVQQPPVVSSPTLADEQQPTTDGKPSIAAQSHPAKQSLSDSATIAARESLAQETGVIALVQHTSPTAPNPAPGTPSPADGNVPQAVVRPQVVAPNSMPMMTRTAPPYGQPSQSQRLESQPFYGQSFQGQPCPPCYNATPCNPQMQQCGPQPWCPNGVPCGGWRPPNLPCPWPKDEYLCDGGDKLPSVRVREDWSVDGLELEDTIVHYDTLNGETHVEPSNRVCLYAPRFASVRKIYGVVQYDHLDRVAKLDQPLPVEGLGDVQIATTNVQPVQPVLNQGSSMASGFRERTPPIGLENREGLVGVQGNVLPYEDITDLQRKLLTNSEKARLADMIQAAMVWSKDIAVQVVIDNIAAHEDIGATAPGSIHLYSLEGKPRLRVCKLASRREARPGETVEFTLQFENIGDQTIGNVTVIDNLTTRLEYVEDSQSCSIKANFSSSDNTGASRTLRWEIVEPMKVGEGGVIRFTCRVR